MINLMIAEIQFKFKIMKAHKKNKGEFFGDSI